MPPKSITKKSPWVECSSCKCEITSNDFKLHSEYDCGHNSADYKVAYIRNYTLYGFIEYIDGSADVNKPKPENLVYISSSAGNICQLEIGEPICLRKGTDTSPAIARRFWPSKSSSLSSILLCSDDIMGLISRNIMKKHSKLSLGLEKTWSNDNNRRVIVSPIKSRIYEATYINITAINAKNVSDEICPLLKQYYAGTMVNKRNKINFNYFGKEHNFKINKISTDENLMEHTESIIWYTLSENTKWKLQDKNANKSESAQMCKTLGGVDTILKEITELIDYALYRNIPKISHIRGVLLFGHSGTGKTAICKSLISSVNCYSITIHGAEIFSKYFGETENTLKNIFKKAFENAPSIIYVDEMDAMCPVKLTGRTDQEKRVSSTFVSLLDSLHDTHSRVFILANTNHPDQVDPSLRRFGRLDHEIEIPVPDKKGRFEILSALLEDVDHSITKDELATIADAAHGFVGADLLNVCTQASMHAIKSKPDSINLHIKDLSWALTMVKPSAMREVLIEVPNVRWDDIGGQDDLKLKLKQAIEWPLKHGDSFTRLGIKPPNGVLMYGPPGCSKTMIAKALANESGLNFLSIKGPELFSKWVGESEKAVRELFRKARQVSPSIIFFDEIDALGGERMQGSGGANVNDRVLAQLLTELDGIIPLNNVVIVAATNRPDKMDRSLLRPGRIDRLVYVPLPDKKTRMDILKITFTKMCVSDDVIVTDLVDQMEGLSGAEVKAVCQEAALKALEEDILCNQVELKHFKTAITSITPRTPKYLLDIYHNFSKNNKI